MRLKLLVGEPRMDVHALTLAGADDEVAVGGDPTEGQVHHRPGVAGAGERSLSHGHGPRWASDG